MPWSTVLRVSIAPRIGLLLVLWLFAYRDSVTELVTRGYWDSVAGQSSTLLVWTAPAVAACAAWEGVRIRQSRALQGAPARTFTSVSLVTLAPTLALGVLAVVLSLGLLLPQAAGSPDGTTAAIVALQLAVVTAHTAVGYVLGLHLPRLPAVPVALVGSFVWMAYPAAMNVFWVRQLNGTNLAECCELDQVAAPRSIIAPALVAVGLLVAAWLVTARGRGPRLLAPVLLAITVAGSAWIVNPLGYSAAEPRSTTARTCSGAHPQICLWPEQRAAAKDVATWATDAHNRLTAVGVTTAAQLSPRASTPTSDDIRAQVALSALPGEIPACARTGEWPGNQAHGPLSAWLTITAGADPEVVATRYAPAEVQAAERALERPPQEQRLWFRQNAKTLTRCDLQPVLDAERP
ncbi:DUF7224 domain-containing protein [Streptomyces zingiberis]|uniref:DUF7224 domain-containing protein n=1 Tax=Streptomyces zingiberis TaxID=2053010 RepID=A0ABX1BWW8_9ACTN|nr:hypothetical protein [Streptomyces zingiberis]NJP99951.1 hypothetical protein [Streptomyces zingiberis]